MRLLALDLGTRRTGVAFFDSATGIPLPLATIAHATVEELLTNLRALIAQRSIEKLIIGMPLLPSGEEGSQVTFVKGIAAKLSALQLPIVFIDERHTTPTHRHPKKSHHGPPASAFDGDAAAAVALLQTYLESGSSEKF